MPISPAKSDKDRELQWQAEEDARTITRAQEIMQDKARLKRAYEQQKKEASAATKAKQVLASALKRKG